MYLKAQGLTHEDEKKQKRRKWVRYMRNIAYLDDASRMVLAGEEFYEIDTENLKLVVDQLAYKY